MKDKIVVFCAGDFCNRLCSTVSHDDIIFVVDNDKNKSGTFIHNLPIKHFDEVVNELKNYTIVIACSKKYLKEIENQLLDNDINDFLSMDKYIVEYRKKIMLNKINQRFDYLKVYSRAIDWILKHSITEKNGKSIQHSDNINVGYPEVTGYYIPTLINWGYRDLAIDYAKWLLDIQKEDGSWYDSSDKSPYVFDTAQIIRGLVAVRNLYPYVDDAIIKGCEWILSNVKDNGRLTTPDYSAWGDKSTCSELIHLYCLYPIMTVGKLFNRNDFIKLSDKIKKYYIENYKKDILNFSLMSHFYAYVMEALLELDEKELVNNAMKKLENLHADDGSVPAYNNVNWTCSTGLFQLAMVWYRLGNLECGDKAFIYTCKLQNDTGGWYGSYIHANYPFEKNDYIPNNEISWANKFFLDALYWRNKLHFNLESNNFLQIIDECDGRYKCVKNMVDNITPPRE